MTLPDFSRLFDDGKEVSTEIGRVVLRPRPAGGLTVTSGRLVACDPFAWLGEEPFTRGVPAGTFPVTLSVAHFEDGDRRVAAAIVRFGERPPASWEMALRPGEDPSELGGGEVFGYTAESGTACFIDQATADLVTDHMSGEEFSDLLSAELEKRYEDTWSWANVEFDPDTRGNIVAFSAGLGESLYPSYFGLDEAGEVVCLVTDFSLFEYEWFA